MKLKLLIINTSYFETPNSLPNKQLPYLGAILRPTLKYAILSTISGENE